MEVHNKIDFSKDTNPLGVSRKAKAAMRKAIKQVDIYPDTVPSKLIRHLAKHHNVTEENFLCGCGATEFIYLLPRVIKPKKALTLLPTNQGYARAIILAGGTVNTFVLEESENFTVPVDPLITSMREYDLVFISNPNDPTGQCVPMKDMMRIAKFASDHEILLVIDESFMDFCKTCESIIQYVTNYKTTAVLRSFSKFYALSGLRSGYLVANRFLIAKFKDLQTPCTFNSIAQAAAVASLRDKRYAEETKKSIYHEKDYFDKELTDLGFEFLPSDSNFFLVRGLNQQQLIQYGVHFSASSFYNLSNNLTKLSIRKHQDNVHLIKLLRSRQLLNH